MRLLMLLGVVYNLLFASSELDEAFERLLKHAQHQKPFNGYNPFEVTVQQENGDADASSQTTSKVKVDESMKIKSIFNQKVFIDNRWYEVGEMIKDYKIIQIESDSIVMQKDSKLHRFGLEKGSINYLKRKKGDR
ncbi:MAG: hypothetical protein ACQESH_04185 [Campylobacterota bacterium]